MLHGRASLHPGDAAFTFADYVNDPAGVSESLTWSRLARRTLNLACELSLHASNGDRAVILAPHSLEYVVAFLGSMQAGLVAVPLPLPHRGSSDDRVSAVLGDASPTVVLTTSAVADDVAGYVDRARLDVVPKIVELDLLNLDGEVGAGLSTPDFPGTAYLQYSSGSTRLPTGVTISHEDYATGAGFTLRFGDGAFGRSPPDGTFFEVIYRTGPAPGASLADANLAADSVTVLAEKLWLVSRGTNRRGGSR